MHDVRYHRPSSIAEALQLAGAAHEASYLSGGQTLIPAMKTRLSAPGELIDLRHIPDLSGIEISGQTVTISAATPHSEVAASQPLRGLCPALCDLAAHIGDPHVRHMGTIGGSVANNDPAADYPAALLALNAIVVTDRREIPASDFFTGLFETALDDGEIITAIRFDAPELAGYAKFPNPASRYAMTGVFVTRDDDDHVRVAVTGAGNDGVFRAEDIEKALADNFSPEALDQVSVSPDDLMSDIHADAEYRANLVMVMARRAVRAVSGNRFSAAIENVKQGLSDTKDRLEEAAGQARARAEDLAEKARAKADDAFEDMRESTAELREKMEKAADDAKDRAGEAYEKARDKAGDIYENARDYADDAIENISEAASDASEKASQFARETGEKIKSSIPEKKRSWLARLFRRGKQ